MRDNGQNLVEFLIIIAVIGLGGIMALTLLGGNINEMFSKSVNKTAKYKPFDYGNPKISNNSSSSTTNNNSTPNSSTKKTPSSSISVDGVDVKINTDGSASFTIGTQNINIPSSAMANLDDVFMSTGSNGGGLTTEVVQAIASLIDAHKDEYPDSDVPINMVFGDGMRDQESSSKVEGGHYAGDATINSITLSVGDHLILIQKDQTHGDEPVEGDYTHVIDGTIKDIYGNGDKQFEGTISSNMPGLDGQVYRSDPVLDNRMNINGSIPGDIASNSNGITASWAFNFDGTNYNL